MPWSRGLLYNMCVDGLRAPPHFDRDLRASADFLRRADAQGRAAEQRGEETMCAGIFREKARVPMKIPCLARLALAKQALQGLFFYLRLSSKVYCARLLSLPLSGADGHGRAARELRQRDR